MTSLSRTMLTACLAIGADTAFADFYLEASATFIDFDYTEYDSSGGFLDGETGRLNGKTVAIGYQTDFVEHSIRHTKYDGLVNYLGITGSTPPQDLVTQTDTILTTTTYQQLWTSLREEYATSFYLRLTRNHWSRNILPTTTPVASSGLSESYQWVTAGIGANFDIYRDWNHAIEIGYGFFTTIGASMLVALDGNSSLGINDEVVSIGLQDMPGTRLTLSYKYRINYDYIIVAVFENTQWEFGENTVDVRRLPTAIVNTIVEPDSKTNNNTLRIGLIAYF